MKRFSILTFLGFLIAALPLAAQQQFQGLCNRVKIAIEQELTTERIGFEAILKVTNNDGEDPINKFSSALTFTDVETGEDATDRFFVQPPELQNINKINGSGIIAPTKKAIVTWFIIPKITAGGEDPRGREYSVGCSLSGYIRGEKIPADVLYAIEDVITVKPEAQLEITYFQPRDVTGDDPFTPEVESPIPFVLGVLVKNSGHGVARKVNIDSKQPKIVENKNGLLLIARLLGARVQDSLLDEASLLVNLGDINPGEVKKGSWDMITSLSGEFVQFKASFHHSDELGGLETSVIKSIAAHFIAHEVLNDEPGRDAIKDFLADTDRDADRLPDTLFETDGAELPVNHQPQAIVGPLAGGAALVTLESDREGWVYMRLDDPGQAAYRILRVTRNDGKVLNPNNYWTNIRYRKSDNFRFTYLSLFDRVETGQTYTYAVTYDTNFSDTTNPITRIRFSGESTESGGAYYITPETQIFFTAEDETPVSIQYQIDGGGFLPALPFRLDDPGSYTVQFFATDAFTNVEVTQTTVLIIPGASATPLALTATEGSIFPTDLISIRPSETPITANVPTSALAIDGNLKIYRGVIAWPRLTGIPLDPTRSGDANLIVSGQFVDYYKYRINGGAWSADIPVADPIELSGLSGSVQLAVLGRHSHGDYLPADQALISNWEVDPAALDLAISGLPTTPTGNAETLQLMLTSGSSSLYRWALGDIGFFRAEEPFSTPIDLTRQSEGNHVLRLISNEGGSWPTIPDPDPVSRARWTFDRAYGYDFSTLEEVRNVALGDVAGQTISFTWDGKSDAGIEQVPGPYTVALTLTDPLGNITRAATLVVIEGLSADRSVLAESSAGPLNLQVARDWAVWQQQSGSVWNVYARNLPSGANAIALSSSTEFDQENPATDGRYAIWQTRLSNGATDLTCAELANPVLRNITSTPGLSEANPAVEWPWIVYQVKSASDPSAPWQIEAYNADSDERFLVSPGVGDQFRPSIHGGRIAWEDHRDVGPGEIYLGDLETRTVRRITHNTYGQNNPTLFGNTILWQDNRDSQVDIWAFDLLKGTEQQVTDTPFNETMPVVAGTWLVYQEDSLGPLTENLVLHDLQSGSSLALTRAERQHHLGGIGNGFAAWIEGSSGGARSAIAGRLPGLQPVMNHANALAVSSGLANRYSSAFELLEGWGGDSGVSSITFYESLSPLVEKTAHYNNGSPTGDDFALSAGTFLWADFGKSNLVDLGPANHDAIPLSSGINVVSYTAFPIGYTAYDLIAKIGNDKLAGLRLFDAFEGIWRSVEIEADGDLVGPNFTIPRVSTLIIDARQAATVNPGI